MENRNTRGSEWNKWDLHIHTPNTGKNDQFEGKTSEEKWENYLRCIEDNKDVRVLGITDYFSMENYYYLKNQQKNKKRIPGVYLIPNVELRLLPVTGSSTPINIHVLFDPKLDKEVIERNFFNTLEFYYNGSKYQCTKDSITQLGKAINGVYGTYSDGLNQFNITLDNLRKALESDVLKGHYLIGVSNNSTDGNSGIQDNALKATRSEIYRLSNFIFSANPTDVKFFLGKGKTSPEDVIKQYGSLKPCICGSDAHKNTDMFKHSNNRYTWIKALPTFEGLKQIIFEPEDRVCICEEKPEEKSDYQVIDTIEFKNKEMESQVIKFNQGLNTIIGGRSSGKSILLGCLATSINPSFTAKDKDRYKNYNNHINQLIEEGVSVRWRDNTSDTRKILYYSQSAISEIVRENEYGYSEVSNLIEEIVKVNEEKQALLNAHETFLTTNKTTINNSINLFCQHVEDIDNKTREIEDIGNKAGIETEIKKIEKEIELIKSTLPDYLSSEEDAKYCFYKKKIQENNEKIDKLTSDANQLKTLKEFQIFSSIDHLLSKLSDDYHEKTSEHYNKIKLRVIQEWRQYIDELSSEIERIKVQIQDETNAIRNEELYLRGEKLQEDNIVIKSKNEKLQEEIKRKSFISKLEEEINKLIAARDNCSKEIWNEFKAYRLETEKLLPKLNTIRDNTEIQAGLN